MRSVILLAISFFLFQKVSLSQSFNNCDSNDFKQLISFSKNKTITDKQFSDALIIINRLDKQRCSDYYVIRNDTNYVVSSLTYLFGRICCNYNNIIGVQKYMEYMQEHSGSAEEQIAYSFEDLCKNPKTVLAEIAKRGEEAQEDLLGLLEFGFVNNRYYGAKDPHESDPNKAFTRYYSPKKVLSAKNYKEIFYQENSDLKKLYPQYRKQIDSLLVMIKYDLQSDQ